MVQIARALWEARGPELTARVEAFVEARRQHAYTVDVPAPTEESLVVSIADEGGVDAVEIIDHDPSGNLLPPETAGLDMVRAAALRLVDDYAERFRLQYLTPGAGQALEYEATEREARAWQEGEPLDAYPFLRAEAEAVAAATGEEPAVSAIVLDVIAQADAWVFIGAAIKRERRLRKLRIEAAEAYEGVAEIVAEPWVLPVADALTQEGGEG